MNQTPKSTKRKGVNGGRGQAIRKMRKQQKSALPQNGNFSLAESMTVRQLKNDARRQTGQVKLPVVENQTRSITTDVALNVTTLEGIAMAYLSKACERGLVAATADGIPYQAFVYLYQILYSYATSGQIVVTQVPYWLLCLGQAISPKTVPKGNGKISYKFAPNNTAYIPLSQNTIGYLPYGLFWNVNTTGGPLIDMFPSSLPPASFDPEVGIVAFEQLVQFMSQESTTTTPSPASKLVPVTMKTRYLSDVSAFAVTGTQEGLGKAGVCGFAQLVQLEVPIFHPLFAVFVASLINPESTGNRFYNFATAFAGDSLYLAGTMSTQEPEENWAMRRMPKFHAIDFLEFGDVVAQWVVGIVQAYNNNANTITAAESAFIAEAASPELKERHLKAKKSSLLQPPTGICPLTLQQMLLILRNTLMGNFQSTQSSVQNLYPRLPEAQADNQFVPLVSSATTCHIQTLDMELPLVLIENLRALTARNVVTKKGDIQQYVPVLGMYVDDLLDTNNYTVTNPVSQESLNVFSTESMTVKRVTTKTGILESVLAEPVINLIDGDSSGSMVFINDPDRLKQLVMLWNQWLATNNIKSFSSPTGSLGTELGISSLCSIAMTRQWVPIPVTKVNADRIVDLRVENMKQVSNTVYTTREVIQDTSQSILFAAAYENVLSKWILPVILAQSGNTYQDQSDPQRWQDIMDEPFAAPTSSGSSGEIQANIHSTYANKMVRSDLSKSNDWDEFFAEQARLGRGGILSSLGSVLDGLLGGI